MATGSGGLGKLSPRSSVSSNHIEVPSVSLPKGGGAIQGIDEKFAVNPVNGTVTFSIPLPITPARGVSPSLNLIYNSGAGNGIFGLGWDLDLSSIKRKTDSGLPQYLDAIDTDTFLFSETEDLVPEFQHCNGSFETDSEGRYMHREKDSPDGLYVIRNYIPRIENSFSRIERWAKKSNGLIKWRVTTPENITTLFGWTDNSVVSDPVNPLKIFEWLPEFVYDDRGNCAQYSYRKEDRIGFNRSLLHNQNRSKNGKITYTNTYLEKVFYGNRRPFHFPDSTFPTEGGYLFSIVFDYGTVGTDESPETLNPWDLRPDAFSHYKAGFEIRTTRLCKRILVFHHFKNEEEYDGLVKSLNIGYNSHPDNPFTFLKKIHSIGYIKKPDGTYASKALPPMQFDYRKHSWNGEVKSLSTNAMIHSPSGLGKQKFQFTDLYSEGLSGILTEQTNGWYYKRNLGGGQFEPAKWVSPMPSLAGAGAAVQLVDLNGDGRKQLASFGDHSSGYYEFDDEPQRLGKRAFTSMPNIDFSNANTRMLDLDGDGRPEVVISEDHVLTWYASEGKNGFAAARKTAKPCDEEEGPHIVFSDAGQTVHLADMTGDGMTDIVRIRNGEVCYWPNMGYGKFGAKVALDNAPVFDYPDRFNPSRLRLADIDGSGTTDIVYLGKNKFSCWKNLNGNEFDTTPFEVESFPEIPNPAHIALTDLLGNGVACIVWSSSRAQEAHAPVKYMDLMNGKKPYILTHYANNMGKEVSIEYTPSTQFYLDDKQTGQPWVTKLHFPIQCVSKTITEDKVTGHKFISEYKYHHGYYDHAEREFRGFGMVEQLDAESFERWVKGNASNIVEEPLHQDPVVTKTWNHTGAFLQRDKILSQFAKDHWYEAMERQGFTTTHHEIALPDARLVTAPELDPSLISQLSEREWQEAQRACKGIALRSEIFTRDADKDGDSAEARKRELTPYSVTAKNYIIELLQPKGKNKHAVFRVKESETMTYAYERHPEDPRISHRLNIKTDAYGNVLESATVVYARQVADTSLPADTQQVQGKTFITYSEKKFTNDVIDDNVYRLRLSSEVKSFQLKGVEKSGTYYAPADFSGILADLNSDTALYHEIDKALVAGRAQKRLIDHVRTTYYSNDLSIALPLHRMESLAFPYEEYQLAYTPELVTDIFGDKVDSPLLAEGKFTNSEGDTGWWARSGTTQYKLSSENEADARRRFYTPVSYTDPHGATTKVTYYGKYFLFVHKTEDALGNTSGAERFNFRTFSPERVKDINGNLSEAIIDELGFVKATAVMGKGNEADELTRLSAISDTAEGASVNRFFLAEDSVQLIAMGKHLLNLATSRFVYDLDAFTRSNTPPVVATIRREQHYRQLANAPVQIVFEYSNGVGEVVMKKVQAEPGKAKQVLVKPDHSICVTEINTARLLPQQLRWIGSGRTIKNNKGRTVKQYEPYFSATHRYEDFKELVETGVTPILFYDGLGRLVKTEMPDGTFLKVEFDSWKQILYDANDTILDSSWFHNRTNRLMDAQLLGEGKDPKWEKLAADKAARHSNTPNVLHFDTLGRPVLSVEHNKNGRTGANEFYHTTVELDIEGNLRTVKDARDNIAMQYKNNMLGKVVYQKSADAGQRWLLSNTLDNPLRTWDQRNHEFQYFYDIMNRPLYSKVLNTAGNSGDSVLDHIFERVAYGESLLTENRSNKVELQARNILGQVIRRYDTGGLVDTPNYDFKGQPIATTRRLFKKYKETANWVDTHLDTDVELEQGFTTSRETDALGRTTQQTAPDGSIIASCYNRTGLLNRESVIHPGSNTATRYILDIDYNEKGQRQKVIYGNNVSTKFHFDKETFRLKRLESKRLNGDLLQDWYYTYDPVGNITHVADKSIPMAFFDNQKISGLSTYSYDALYRLVEATGRENDAALSFGPCDNWNDKPFRLAMNPGDTMAMRNYTRRYQYDPVGNITEMKHMSIGGNWRRIYEYETANNRLKSTQIGGNGNPTRYTRYKHHEAHGFMMELPHLEKIGWNFKEEVVHTSKQRCTDDHIPIITYYQYDGNGQRIRTITENQAGAGARPTKKEERIYIDGYELYIKHSNPNKGLERTSLSLIDEGHRFVTIETRNEVNDGTEEKLVRYQLYNHLGSSTLELDGTPSANIISYEEYHPYGTTAYQAKNQAIKSASKRYRYTGMERDEETGLEYHSARYYLPWLGRWLSCDPLYNEPKNEFRDPQAVKGDTKNRNAYSTVGHDIPSSDGTASPYQVQGENHDRIDPVGPAHGHQRKKYANSPDQSKSGQEGLSNSKTLNLYAYGALNPILYKDPTGTIPILQEWWNGYNNASTAGKVGYGFLFILAWLAHVIVNIAVLLFSVFIQNLLSFWDFSYGGIQSTLGLGLGIFTILLGADVRPHWGMGAEVEMPEYMKFYVGYGVSLGPVTFGGHGFSDWDHEAGHTWQSRVLGPLYLFIIGIPSAAGADYTEDWADDWAT